MSYSSKFDSRLHSSQWSKKIAGKVIGKRRKRIKKQRTFLVIGLLVLIAIPFVNNLNLNNSSWDDYLSSWLQQEETTFDITEGEFANLFD